MGRTPHEESGRGPAKATPGELGPERGRKEVQRGKVGPEGARGPDAVLGELLGPRARSRRRAAAAARAPVSGPRRRRLDLQQVVGQRQAHVGARADAALDVAFGREPLERAHDGAAAEPVLTGQVPAGRQTGARAQAPRQDFVSEGLTQPGGRGLARGPGRQRQREGGALLGHNGTVKILKMALCASTLERYCGVPKEER